MAWIAYKENRYEHDNWLELVDYLRAQGKWQMAVGQVINQWVNGLDPLSAKTSGSTGEPRQISLRRSEVEASAKLTAETFHLPKGATALLNLPSEFIAGKMMVIRALVNNWNLIVSTPDTNALANIDCDIDFAAMTPYQVEQSLVRFPQAIQRIKKMIIGGAAVSPTLEAKLQELTTTCWATYGMTETITHVAIRQLNGEERSEMYSALKGVSFERDDNECLVIHAGHIESSPIVTNDQVELIDEKTFRLLGRRDNIINSGGLKLFPEVIERKIIDLMHRRYFITGIPHEEFGERPCLVIEGEAFSQQIEEAILEAIQDRVDRFECPERVVYVPEFEITLTGKIKRTLP